MLLNGNPEQKSSPVRKNADVPPRKQVSNNLKSLGKLATFSSFLCSIVAASLIAGNFFGRENFLENKIIREACSRVHGILIASVLLGILAMVISPSEYNAVYFNDIYDEQPIGHKAPEKKSKSGNLHENVWATTTACKSKTNKQITEAADCNSSHIERCKKEDILPINSSASYSPLSNERAVVLYSENQTRMKNGCAEASRSISQLPGSNRVPFLLCSSNSFDSSRKQTVTEFVASRRMTYFSESGKIQGLEEMKIRRIIDFDLDAKTKCPTGDEQDTILKNSSKYSRENFVGPTHFGPTYAPQNDRVSEVITKMEALQFFY